MKLIELNVTFPKKNHVTYSCDFNLVIVVL